MTVGREIELSYSLDGTTFSDAVKFQALEIWCDLNPMEETEGARSNRQTNVKCIKHIARFKVDIRLSMANFDPAIEDAADAARIRGKFLQVWLCATHKRLYFADGSEHFIGGWDLFDTDDNTNYLNYIRHEYVYRAGWADETAQDARKIFAVDIELEARNAYTLPTFDTSGFSDETT